MRYCIWIPYRLYSQPRSRPVTFEYGLGNIFAILRDDKYYFHRMLTYAGIDTYLTTATGVHLIMVIIQPVPFANPAAPDTCI